MSMFGPGLNISFVRDSIAGCLLFLLMVIGTSAFASAPSLDELLGLEEEADAAPAQAQAAPPGELFDQVLSHMQSSATALLEEGDAGLSTQRQQQSALDKLDQLIDQMSQAGSSGGGSSSARQADAGDSASSGAQRSGAGIGRAARPRWGADPG